MLGVWLWAKVAKLEGKSEALVDAMYRVACYADRAPDVNECAAKARKNLEEVGKNVEKLHR